MIIGLGHLEATRLGTTLVAAFLASLVECVEALTVVLAVGSVRGWRSVLAGAAAGALLLNRRRSRKRNETRTVSA